MYPEVGDHRATLGIAGAGQSLDDVTEFHLRSVVWGRGPAGLAALFPLRAVDQARCLFSLDNQTVPGLCA